MTATTTDAHPATPPAPAPTAGLDPLAARPWRPEAVADLLPGHLLIHNRTGAVVVVSTTKVSDGWEITTHKPDLPKGRRSVIRLHLADGQAHADSTVTRLADTDDLASIREALHETGEHPTARGSAGKIHVIVHTPLGDWTITL